MVAIGCVRLGLRIQAPSRGSRVDVLVAVDVIVPVLVAVHVHVHGNDP